MITRTFTVSGTGPFPYDMLRYDACWPSDSEDARKMNCPYCENNNDRTMRTIMLKSNSMDAPTVKRWESFTWKVSMLIDTFANF